MSDEREPAGRILCRFRRRGLMTPLKRSRIQIDEESKAFEDKYNPSDFRPHHVLHSGRMNLYERMVSARHPLGVSCTCLLKVATTDV